MYQYARRYLDKMSLLDAFNEKMSKIKGAGSSSEQSFDVLYSTGFLAIDYLNGTTVHVKSKDRNFSYISAGVADGSTCTIIGRSGSGKSTLTMQIAGNIVKPFIEAGMDANIYIDDIEKSLPESRKYFLLGMNDEVLKNHLDIRTSGITTENVYKRLCAIRDIKIQNSKEYTYDTGLFDLEGNRVFKLIPTVYVIDSFAMLMPENLQVEDELGGSMDASSIAKNNTALIKKIAQICTEANIMLFTVNHIMDDIQMGFIPKPAQISGLKQGERLPGGRTAIYLANNMFRVDDSKTLKPTEGFGIDGSVVNFTIIKSRTNATKKSIPLIFNKTIGKFDEDLSLFYLLKENGKVEGAGKMYLPNLPDVKFSQKTFKEVFADSPELQKEFARECFEILKTFLSDTETTPAVASSGNFKNYFDEFAKAENDE